MVSILLIVKKSDEEGGAGGGLFLGMDLQMLTAILQSY